MKDIFAELQWRGLAYQSTDDEHLGQWLMDSSRTVYAGFDPTADSLHVGSLLPLLILRRFQRAGHRPIALAGGATGMIGDPSGKNAERNLLDAATLQANLEGIERQMRQLLEFDDGPTSALLVNNIDWIGQASFVSFLRDVGKHFPVNVMLAKDSVKNRLTSEAGLSYTEFSYMLLQAYDFVHLNREYGCELQVGGSDQWGNITAGVELARRMHSTQVRGLTSPLLTKSDGTKMGKTETGTIWLDASKTSPYQFFQYWINTTDDDVSKCLRFLTELEQEEIDELDRQREQNPGGRASQQRLAECMTELIHGQQAVERAKTAAQILFGAEIDSRTDEELNEIFEGVPCWEASRNQLAGDGLGLIDALNHVGLCKSKSEARRAINEGGAYVNNRRRENVDDLVSLADLASESMIVLRRGKKKFGLIKLVD